MRRELPDWRRAARTVPCSYCGAVIGQPCRTVSGQTTWEHMDRVNKVWLAFRIGVEGGLRDALYLLDGLDSEDLDPLARQYDVIRATVRRDERKLAQKV